MAKRAYSAVIKRVLKYLKRYIPLVALTLALSVISVALTLWLPYLIGDAVDLIIGPKNVDFAGLTAVLAKAGVVVGVTAVLQYAIALINNRITYCCVRDIRCDTFKKLQTLPFSYLDSQPQGDILSRIITDAETFADGLLMGFTHLFTGVLTVFGTLFLMYEIDWRIATVVVVLTPMSLLIARFIANRTYSFYKAQSETRGEETAYIEEHIKNHKLVEAFGRETASIEGFEELDKRLERVTLKATFFSSLVNPTTRFVNSLVYAAVAISGAIICIMTASSAIPFTVGQLTCFLSKASHYAKPFNEISGVIAELQNAIACASRVFELLDEPSEIPDKKDAGILENVEGDVMLDGVDFSYTPEKPLIEDLNVHAKSGQRIAIVGPTGCGKTTVINLLMRFYDPLKGEIRVDGKSITDVTRHSLRSSYGMVLQDTWLKSGTVRENISFGNAEATLDEIRAAAKAAHADGFIRRLPNGYDTVIGEEGESISQGQKQLLCIARVMLSLPPMLILDEATSSIDTRTEMKIQSAFSEMMKGRTSFIVAHRLSTIREADLILVMRDGKIIEQGVHHELLKAGGFYSELYNSQFDD